MKSCFVIMPFTSTKIGEKLLDQQSLNYIFEKVIKRATGEFNSKQFGVFSEILRYNSRIGSIISGITNHLSNADLVIADLTGLNSNVMYELGVRHSLKRGTIIISQDLSSIPSDLRDYMCVGYRFSESTIDQDLNYDKFKNDLHSAITELFSTNKFDSPILSYLNGREGYWKEDEVKRLKEEIIVFTYIFDNYLEVQEILASTQLPPFEIQKKLLPKINSIHNGLLDLSIPSDSSDLYTSLQAAKSLFSDILKSCITNDYFEGLSRVIPDAENPFSNMISLITSTKFPNYFYLLETDKPEVSVFDVFNDEEDFYSEFLDRMDDYLELKAKGLGITEEEIDFLLKQ